MSGEQDPTPGPSGAFKFSSPKQRRRKKGHLSFNEKITLINVYKHLEETWPKDLYVYKKDIAEKTAEITGVTIATVYNVLNEYSKEKCVRNPLPVPSKIKTVDKLDDMELSGIRRQVQGFFFKNDPPTIDKVLCEVNNDNNLPNFKRTTFYKVLKHMKFRYLKRNRKSVLIEKNEIVMWRVRYLDTIMKMREAKRDIFYLDETWVNQGHAKTSVWQDETIQSSRQAHKEGLSTGLKAPSGKGKRLIIVHIGNENGFLEDGPLVFESKRHDTDYHSEMNSTVFEEWFDRICDKLPQNAVVCMDNTSYHSRRLERVPTTQWRKEDIQNWLKDKSVEFSPASLKAGLLDLVQKEKHKYMAYAVDEKAKAKGIDILRLPPYHCELNPIEMIWAQVKGYVAKNNKTFKFPELKRLLNDGINTITPDAWRSCVNHVIKEEKNMAKLDGIVDNVVDSFIINVGPSGSDMSVSESSESE